MTPARRLFAAALLLDVLGAGAALLITTRTWQTIHVTRPRPLADLDVSIDGRGLDGALLGAVLVALAGVVAVLATKGVARQVVGGLIAAAGVLLGWRAVANLAAVGRTRALELVTSRKGSVGITSASATRVTTHPSWPVLTVVAAVLVIGAGVLVAAFGRRWSSMSTRYEAPTSKPAAGDEAMWTALDRGDDPTSRTES
jgi:uncharacterized membrane protein (TIGR02234 family)